VFILAIVLAFLLCFIISISSFYKKIFKDNGYLTNTLPVSKKNIIFSKLITSIIFIILTIIVVVLSLLITFYTEGIIGDLWNSFTTALNESGIENVGSIYVAIFILILTVFLQYVNTLFIFFCGISIGHSFSNKKLEYSIMCVALIYIALQVISSIGLISGFLIRVDFTDIMNNNIPMSIDYFIQIFGIACGINVISITTLFCITNNYLKNKLNLE